MEVIVDNRSGFCFGVRKAINFAERELATDKELFCLGDIVHNEEEVERLAKLGLKVIDRDQYFTLSNCKVLLRAHGEPPEIYQYAKDNNIELIDGTCTVVSKLQQRIKSSYQDAPDGTTLVIFGKPNHPEIIGINGQLENKAVIVQKTEDLDQIDFKNPILLFSQTTMDRQNYRDLKVEIENRLEDAELLNMYDSICGQVANRVPGLQEFSKTVDALVFVGGKKSSNSKVLYSLCKQTNPNSFFISTIDEIGNLSLDGFDKVGVCGATSTPNWLINEVAEKIKEHAAD